MNKSGKSNYDESQFVNTVLKHTEGDRAVYRGLGSSVDGRFYLPASIVVLTNPSEESQDEQIKNTLLLVKITSLILVFCDRHTDRLFC